MPYIDSEIDLMENGGEPAEYLRHFHWGLFDDLDRSDDEPERYFTAARAMTERVIAAGGIEDDRRVLDVGCGFGGTLDMIKARNRGCKLAGVNIDERQLQWAQKLLANEGAPGDQRISFATADGCVLPVASGTVDNVLAVECIFHFPSRKKFFAEVARVLKPGGTLALSDFLLAPGAAGKVVTNVEAFGLGNWYGYSSRPLSSAAFERLGRSVGMELLLDDDVTAETLPTYPALRRLYSERGEHEAAENVDGVERLAQAGGWEYHVLAFRKPAE